MAGFTPFGPGTVTLKIGSATASDFSGEVLGGAVGHAYSDSGEARTMMNGDVRSAAQKRDNDSITLSVENDLTASGLYKYLQDNDLAEATLEYTPNTVGAAKWAGTVVLSLPEEIGSDEFGSPIVSEVTWQATGKLTFTAAT
jgi:hypothetical protein